jgi:hypothetical protein
MKNKSVGIREKNKQLQAVVQDLKKHLENLLTTLQRDYKIKVNIIWEDELVNLVATRPPEIIFEMTFAVSKILMELYKLNPTKIKPMNLDIGLGALFSFEKADLADLPKLKKLYSKKYCSLGTGYYLGCAQEGFY